MSLQATWRRPGVVRASLWTGELERMHPRRTPPVAELLGGEPPVTVLSGASS